MSNYLKQEKINKRFKLIIKAIQEEQSEDELAEELGITSEAIRLFLHTYFDTTWDELKEKYYDKK